MKDALMGFPSKSNGYGWRGNKLGLQEGEVMTAHQARLHATEAVAALMRRGRSFEQAKAEVVKRAASVYKHFRPALYHGTMACVEDVRYSDMPRDIHDKAGNEMIDLIERVRGKKLSRLNKWAVRTFGMRLY